MKKRNTHTKYTRKKTIQKNTIKLRWRRRRGAARQPPVLGMYHLSGRRRSVGRRALRRLEPSVDAKCAGICFPLVINCYVLIVLVIYCCFIIALASYCIVLLCLHILKYCMSCVTPLHVLCWLTSEAMVAAIGFVSSSRAYCDVVTVFCLVCLHVLHVFIVDIILCYFLNYICEYKCMHSLLIARTHVLLILRTLSHYALYGLLVISLLALASFIKALTVFRSFVHVMFSYSSLVVIMEPTLMAQMPFCVWCFVLNCIHVLMCWFSVCSACVGFCLVLLWLRWQSHIMSDYVIWISLWLVISNMSHMHCLIVRTMSYNFKRWY